MAILLNQSQVAAIMNHQGMSKEEKVYFQELGARIAQRRQELSLTQTQVADALKIAQQTYASYEVGRHRIPVSLLPALSRALSMDTDTLLGITKPQSKRGPAPKFQQQIEQIGKLPKVQQKIVVKMLDGLLAEHSR